MFKKQQKNKVICPKCGKFVDPGARFCPHCGGSLDGALSLDKLSQVYKPFRDYMGINFFVTIFCTPFNLVGLVFSILARGAYNKGQVERARRLAAYALISLIVSFPIFAASVVKAWNSPETRAALERMGVTVVEEDENGETGVGEKSVVDRMIENTVVTQRGAEEQTDAENGAALPDTTSETQPAPDSAPDFAPTDASQPEPATDPDPEAPAQEL
ncbi:MAG: CD225/dispanin family protein [Planctomycetia bacterium]|nr:CD225/dispanin family protein [Planctomycetia bacterium]